MDFLSLWEGQSWRGTPDGTNFSEQNLEARSQHPKYVFAKRRLPARIQYSKDY